MRSPGRGNADEEKKPIVLSLSRPRKHLVSSRDLSAPSAVCIIASHHACLVIKKGGAEGASRLTEAALWNNGKWPARRRHVVTVTVCARFLSHGERVKLAAQLFAGRVMHFCRKSLT